MRRAVDLDDFDEAAVLRATWGERLPLPRADRVEAVRRLHRQGLNDREIAGTLGTYERQVQRDKADRGLTARRATPRSRVQDEDQSRVHWEVTPAGKAALDFAVEDERVPYALTETGRDALTDRDGCCRPGCSDCRERIRRWKLKYGAG